MRKVLAIAGAVVFSASSICYAQGVTPEMKPGTKALLFTFNGLSVITAGNFEGGLSRPHQIDVDQDGALYVANYEGGWVNKFVPRAGADPDRIIGRLQRLD